MEGSELHTHKGHREKFLTHSREKGEFRVTLGYFRVFSGYVRPTFKCLFPMPSVGTPCGLFEEFMVLIERFPAKKVPENLTPRIATVAWPCGQGQAFSLPWQMPASYKRLRKSLSPHLPDMSFEASFPSEAEPEGFSLTLDG